MALYNTSHFVLTFSSDLATHCRLLLHDRPKHRRLVRYAVLYPLYVLCEIAIISTDLAELLGSAIGLCLIFPTLPLWAGVLLTASDVLVFLLLGDPSRGQGKPVKTFEYTVMALVSLIASVPFCVCTIQLHLGVRRIGMLHSASRTSESPLAPSLLGLCSIESIISNGPKCTIHW